MRYFPILRVRAMIQIEQDRLIKSVLVISLWIHALLRPISTHAELRTKVMYMNRVSLTSYPFIMYVTIACVTIAMSWNTLHTPPNTVSSASISQHLISSTPSLLQCTRLKNISQKLCYHTNEISNCRNRPVPKPYVFPVWWIWKKIGITTIITPNWSSAALW